MSRLLGQVCAASPGVFFHRKGYVTNSLAIGLIDDTNDNKLFDSKRTEIIRALAKAIRAEVGITHVEPAAQQPSNGGTLYRVMAGSFSVKENAEQQVQRLKAAGFDAIIMAFNK